MQGFIKQLIKGCYTFFYWTALTFAASVSTICTKLHNDIDNHNSQYNMLDPACLRNLSTNFFSGEIPDIGVVATFGKNV